MVSTSLGNSWKCSTRLWVRSGGSEWQLKPRKCVGRWDWLGSGREAKPNRRKGRNFPESRANRSCRGTARFPPNTEAMPSGLYPRESLHSRGPSCALGKQLYFQVHGTNPSEPLRLGCNPGPGLSVLLFCSPVHPSLNLKAISSKEKPVAGMSLLLQTIYRNWAPPSAPESTKPIHV